jgi:hypothetical protein
MAQHDVEYTTPSAMLDTRDLVFVVQRDGVKLGEMRVSKGSVVWFPYNTRYGYRLDWSQLDRLILQRYFS